MYYRKEEAVAKDKKSSKKEKESKDKHKKGIMHLQQIYIYIYVLRRGKRDLKSEKIQIDFGIACYYGHSAGHFYLKNRSLVPFLTELLRVQLLETHCL